VAAILKSPTYIGKIVWDKKKHIKKGSKGNTKHIIIHQPKENWTIVDGVHPPIVTKKTFDHVQEIMVGRYIPSKKDGSVKSPLVGLVRCQNCGRNMQRITIKDAPYLMCVETGCCASAKFEFVEKRVLMHLQDILDDLMVEKQNETPAPDTSLIDEKLTTIRRELTAAENQKARLYDLLEMGEYDLQLFRERMAVVKSKLENLEREEQQALANIKRIQKIDKSSQAKKIATVLESYAESDAPQRNALLHSIVAVIWYSKAKRTKPTEFSLQVELKPF
jgi:hypothetical protein